MSVPMSALGFAGASVVGALPSVIDHRPSSHWSLLVADRQMARAELNRAGDGHDSDRDSPYEPDACRDACPGADPMVVLLHLESADPGTPGNVARAGSLVDLAGNLDIPSPVAVALDSPLAGHQDHPVHLVHSVLVAHTVAHIDSVDSPVDCDQGVRPSYHPSRAGRPFLLLAAILTSEVEENKIEVLQHENPNRTKIVFFQKRERE